MVKPKKWKAEKQPAKAKVAGRPITFDDPLVKDEKVEAGVPGSAEFDTGVVIRVGAPGDDVKVKWDSGVTYMEPTDELRRRAT